MPKKTTAPVDPGLPEAVGVDITKANARERAKELVALCRQGSHDEAVDLAYLWLRDLAPEGGPPPPPPYGETCVCCGHLYRSVVWIQNTMVDFERAVDRLKYADRAEAYEIRENSWKLVVEDDFAARKARFEHIQQNLELAERSRMEGLARARAFGSLPVNGGTFARFCSWLQEHSHWLRHRAESA